MRMLRFLGIAVGGVVLLGLAAGVAARMSDGPLAIFPGGPLVAGERVTEPVADWGFANEIDEVELQLLEPARSRTVWIAVHEGAAYIPCGFLDVPIWKQWPHEAAADGRGLLRVEGRIHQVELVRVTDRPTFETVLGIVADKYGLPRAEEPDMDTAWVFRLDPR